MWTMKGDGTSKQLVAGLGPLDTNTWEVTYEPSCLLHGGRRWFLNLRFAESNEPGPALYAPRWQVWAISSDGTNEMAVPLTDGDDVTLWPQGSHWLPGDQGVSLTSVRWEQLADGSWQPYEAGIYVIPISFDGSGFSVPGPPELVLPCGWFVYPPEYDDPDPHPCIGSHDWSPDASAVVYPGYEIADGQERYTGVWLVNLSDPDNPVQLTDGYTPHRPLWSPDGALIAFDNGHEINIITPTGQGQQTLHSTRVDSGIHIDAHAWSPDSKYLLCRYQTNPLKRPANVITDLYRLSTSGEWVNLTGDTDAGAEPIGWR